LVQANGRPRKGEGRKTVVEGGGNGGISKYPKRFTPEGPENVVPNPRGWLGKRGEKALRTCSHVAFSKKRRGINRVTK